VHRILGIFRKKEAAIKERFEAYFQDRFISLERPKEVSRFQGCDFDFLVLALKNPGRSSGISPDPKKGPGRAARHRGQSDSRRCRHRGLLRGEHALGLLSHPWRVHSKPEKKNPDGRGWHSHERAGGWLKNRCRGRFKISEEESIQADFDGPELLDSSGAFSADFSEDPSSIDFTPP